MKSTLRADPTEKFQIGDLPDSCVSSIPWKKVIIFSSMWRINRLQSNSLLFPFSCAQWCNERVYCSNASVNEGDRRRDSFSSETGKCWRRGRKGRGSGEVHTREWAKARSYFRRGSLCIVRKMEMESAVICVWTRDPLLRFLILPAFFTPHATFQPEKVEEKRFTITYDYSTIHTQRIIELVAFRGC